VETSVDLPFFEPRHREFAESFRSWVSAELATFESNEGGDGKAATQIFEILARNRWLPITVATDTGKSRAPIDLRTVCLIRESLGYSSAIADVSFSEPWLAALPLALYGSSEQKRRYLEPFCAGECLPAFALSEPEAGSDVAAIATTATLSGEGYVLNGQKTWTSNSGLANVYVVFARTDGEAGARGISAFLVGGDTAGVQLQERLRVMPPHTVGTLRFENCSVSTDSVLGEPGQGFEIAMKALELFRPTVGAATLGFARRAMHEAVARSTQRVAFKKPISEHQLIQAKLADMAVKTEAAALLVYRAAWGHDVGSASVARDASIAKLYSSEIAQEVIDEALQIFGGLGVVEGTTVERLYRHVRAFRIFDGTSEIQRLIIAKNLLSK
jgi:acyl-CoA dehydrogenase